MNDAIRAGLAVLIGAVCAAGSAAATVRDLPTGAFEVTQELVLPGSPEDVFDAITGDVSAWWDHSFSEHPKRLFIEPRPGGGFWEIFDDDGNGVRHAVVTGADRGKMLRFEGPLGFAGNALLMVHTFEFSPEGDGATRLKLTVRASGHVESGWADAADGVWRHFLIERFEPYYESGAYKKR